jgi:hypothetical protein
VRYAQVINSIKQGESLPYTFDLDGESTDGWVCTLNLKKYPDDKTLINRTVTAVDNEWTGFLTSKDTKNLDVSQYTLIAKLTNASTNEKDQDTQRFYVTQSWS